MRLLAVFAVALLGCKGEQARPAGTPAGQSGSGTGSSHAASGPITEVDARELGEKLALAVIPCNAASVGPLLDDPSLTEPFCQWMAGIASYHLVGVRVFENEQRPIMRRLFAEPSSGALHVNYDQVKLARKGDALVLRDVYSYRQGRWLSETLPGAPSHPDIDKARDLIKAGKPDEAFALVEKLPANLRRDLMLRAFISADLRPDQASVALADLAKTFPDDPAIALTEIDGAYDRDDFDAMIHWCDVVEKEIGPDAYLSAQRAVAYLKKHDLPHALEQANAAVAREPTLTYAHQVKLDVLIEQKSWPQVLAEMTELEKNHGQHFDEAALRAEPRLSELVSSPAFAQWLQDH